MGRYRYCRLISFIIIIIISILVAIIVASPTHRSRLLDGNITASFAPPRADGKKLRLLRLICHSQCNCTRVPHIRRSGRIHFWVVQLLSRAQLEQHLSSVGNCFANCRGVVLGIQIQNQRVRNRLNFNYALSISCTPDGHSSRRVIKSHALAIAIYSIAAPRGKHINIKST